MNLAGDKERWRGLSRRLGQKLYLKKGKEGGGGGGISRPLTCVYINLCCDPEEIKHTCHIHCQAEVIGILLTRSNHYQLY